MSNCIACTYDIGDRTLITGGWGCKNVAIPHAKLYYMHKGEIYLEIGREKLVARKGDLLLIPANLPHTCMMIENRPFEKSWCHFLLTDGGRDLLADYSFPYMIHVDEDAAVCALFSKLFSTRCAVPPLCDMQESSAILQLVSYYFSHCSFRLREREGSAIDSCIRYMETHYAENINVEQLARLSNYSLNHFIKKFKQVSGTTPAKFLTSVRLEMAKRLLRDTSLPIGTVMVKAGFYDSAHFAKLFKRSLGYSPRRFRELYRNAQTAGDPQIAPPLT